MLFLDFLPILLLAPRIGYNKGISWLTDILKIVTAIWGANLLFLYIYLEYQSFKRFVAYFGYTALFFEIFFSAFLGILGAILALVYASAKSKEGKVNKNNECIIILLVAGFLSFSIPAIWSDILALIIFVGLLIG